MSHSANDQTYIAKVKRMAIEHPERLTSEVHEAHYLLESGVISQEAYEIIYAICTNSRDEEGLQN